MFPPLNSHKQCASRDPRVFTHERVRILKENAVGALGKQEGIGQSFGKSEFQRAAGVAIVAFLFGRPLSAKSAEVSDF
jgi:hypothetical protein